MQKGYQMISQEEAVEIMKTNPDARVVDVRTEKEYKEGHIPDATLAPIEEIRKGKLDALPDKEQPLLLYCRTGRRAEDAAAILAKEGYTDVSVFGGILEWSREVVKE